MRIASRWCFARAATVRIFGLSAVHYGSPLIPLALRGVAPGKSAVDDMAEKAIIQELSGKCLLLLQLPPRVLAIR
jgi:hypothetical protein